MSRRDLPRLVDRAGYLVAAATGRRVLHVGCAGAPYTAADIDRSALLHDRLGAVASRLIGVDTDRAGLDLLATHGHQDLIRITTSIDEQLDEIPAVDVIVAGEVIEHVDDAGAFLRSLRTVMERDGAHLEITTINAYCLFRMLQYAWPRRGRLVEPVHPDHVAYYSLHTLDLLCARNGLDVVDAAFYDLSSEDRAALPRRIKVANSAVRWFPQLADGIAVRCRLASGTAGD